MKTRMLAATSIAPQVTQNKLVEHLSTTFIELTNKHLKENTTHGLLLQVIYTFSWHLLTLATNIIITISGI